MAGQSKGYCKYCGNEYIWGGIRRHLHACKERKAVLASTTGKRACGYFEMLLYGKYDHTYWLIIEMPDTRTLQDLDQFIRDIWMECCGHLSSFRIYGESYDAYPDTEGFWGEPAKSMNYRLKDILSEGLVMDYEYDFGSPTELEIKVLHYRQGVWKRDPVTILSRNNPPELLCSHCKENHAQWIDPTRLFEEEAFWCESCRQAHIQAKASKTAKTDGTCDDSYEDFDEEYFLPVCNSPRMGVCAYEGSELYPDTFEPDKRPVG